jgi:hypothetical protein
MDLLSKVNAWDNVVMSYRPLPFSCFCGEIPDRILEIGFTSDAHMVIHYWCSSCNRVLFISKTLQECAAACPPPDESDKPSDDPEGDARFLQSLGIALDQ